LASAIADFLLPVNQLILLKKMHQIDLTHAHRLLEMIQLKAVVILDGVVLVFDLFD
jgi:hypothetical protein